MVGMGLTHFRPSLLPDGAETPLSLWTAMPILPPIFDLSF